MEIYISDEKQGNINSENNRGKLVSTSRHVISSTFVVPALKLLQPIFLRSKVLILNASVTVSS